MIMLKSSLFLTKQSWTTWGCFRSSIQHYHLTRGNSNFPAKTMENKRNRKGLALHQMWRRKLKKRNPCKCSTSLQNQHPNHLHPINDSQFIQKQEQNNFSPSARASTVSKEPQFWYPLLWNQKAESSKCTRGSQRKREKPSPRKPATSPFYYQIH